MTQPHGRAGGFIGRLLPAGLTLAAVLWAAAIIATPYQSRHAPVFTALVHAAAARLGHQRPERSFHLAGAKLPVCARCTGLYLSAAAGALAAWLAFVRVPRRTRALLAVAAAPTAATWLLEWAGGVAMSNALRALASLPLGAAVGWLFVGMLRADRSGHMRYDPLTYGHEIDRRRESASRF